MTQNGVPAVTACFKSQTLLCWHRRLCWNSAGTSAPPNGRNISFLVKCVNYGRAIQKSTTVVLQSRIQTRKRHTVQAAKTTPHLLSAQKCPRTGGSQNVHDTQEQE